MKYLRSIIWAGCIILFLAFSPTAGANYDEDFKQASDLENYPGITYLQSAQLVINLASVIHQENLHIIQTLHNIQGRLEKIESSSKAKRRTE